MRMNDVLLVAVGLLVLPQAGSAQVVKYYHLDAVGNVRAVTDQNGQVIERHDYLPFGEEWCGTGSCGSATAGQPRRFTGKERDQETGLDYFGARHYGSRVGRFTTVDPVYTWRENLVDPQRWNRYAYGRNNPLRYVDPDGQDIRDYFGGVVNAFGSNLAFGYRRASGGNADFQFGQFVGDVFSIPAGAAEADLGTGVGGLGILGAPETGGASLVATGAGALMVVQGGAATVSGSIHAGIYLAKQLGQPAETGSYTITFASGKRYHGKGPQKRANDSAKRVGEENAETAAQVEWKPATNQKEAFKAEARRIRGDAGVQNPDNYNKINSPGERLLKKEQ